MRGSWGCAPRPVATAWEPRSRAVHRDREIGYLEQPGDAVTEEPISRSPNGAVRQGLRQVTLAGPEGVVVTDDESGLTAASRERDRNFRVLYTALKAR